jgi:hypothetical protein
MVGLELPDSQQLARWDLLERERESYKLGERDCHRLSRVFVQGNE